MRTTSKVPRMQRILGAAAVVFAVSALLAGCGGAAPDDEQAPAADESDQAQETVERTVPTRLSEQESDYSDVEAPVEYIHVTLRAGANAQLRLKINQVQAAVNMFKAEQARTPESTQELLDMNYGPLPSLKEGLSFRIDQATGEVTIVERVPRGAAQ